MNSKTLTLNVCLMLVLGGILVFLVSVNASGWLMALPAICMASVAAYMVSKTLSINE